MNLELVKNELKSLVRTKFAKPLNSQKSFEELSELTKLSAQTLRRFFGKIEHKVKAPPEGYIINVTDAPIIYQGDAIFHISTHLA